MAERAKQAGVIFRPHFKTHQSHEVGKWFREVGVNRITCSSLRMAKYFSDDGWSDITVAFPVNVLEVDLINSLAVSITLNILVESIESVKLLGPNINEQVGVFIKIDAGYGRTGINSKNLDELNGVIEEISKVEKLNFKGFLAHAGNSYSSRGRDEIEEVHQDTLQNLEELKNHFEESLNDLTISVGDTPTCSIMNDFGIADEIRPGCFVFYDMMQEQIGACENSEIAVAMACPVVATHPERNEIVIYGGGVHFSKEKMVKDGRSFYGQVVETNGIGWGDPIPDTYIKSLSQEHGIISAPDKFIETIEIGDIVHVLPVHVCMAADLADGYLTTDGNWIEKRVNSLR